MNILVLLKMVSQQSFSDLLATDDGISRLESGNLVMNPADKYALELALRIKDTHAETVITVVTMAPDNAEIVLREALGMGADKAILLSDKNFTSSDTIATSKVLSRQIKISYIPDLILCGKNSIDSETGHVPAQIADLIGVPFISNVLNFSLNKNDISYTRSDDFGVENGVCALPAVVSIIYGTDFVRNPSICGLRNAKDKKIEKLDSKKLGLKQETIGRYGSSIETIRIDDITFPKRRPKIETDINAGVNYLIKEFEKFRKINYYSDNKFDSFIPETPDANSNEIWVVTGPINMSSLGLIKKAKELAEEKGMQARNIVIEDEHFKNYKDVVNKLSEQYNSFLPSAVIFERTQFLADVAPAFAARIGRWLTAGCTNLVWDDKHGLLQIRPAFGGRKIAVNVGNKLPYISTVRRGAFSTSDLEINVSDNNTLDAAPLIFSGGLGLGSKTSFNALSSLANNVNAQLGASRGAVSANYTDYHHQIGLTGVSVHPKLYVAFGISGAIQHLSGIMESEKIISINNNLKSQITNYADYVLVADANAVIMKLQSHYTKYMKKIIKQV